MGLGEPVLNDPLKGLPKKEKITQIKEILEREGWYIKGISKDNRLKVMSIIANYRGGYCLSRKWQGTLKKLHWKCINGHKWYANPGNIIYKAGWCPYCIGHIPLTLDIMQKLAKTQGGKCLSTKYMNQSTKLRWECAEGHIWEAEPRSIRNHKTWCPHCVGNAPLTLKIMKELAKIHNGECLATKYNGVNTKLRWRCEFGHIWEATPANIKHHKSWCPYCAGNAPLTLEICQSIARDRNGECLSTKYKGTHTKLRWRCEFGHEWEAPPGRIKSSERWCPYCAGNAPLTLDVLQNIARERGGECLATEYINSKTKVFWECGKGHIWNASASAVKGGTWCPYCAGKAPLTLEICHQLAQSHGGECLSTKYINCDTKMEWKCKKGHIWETTTDCIKYGGTWCPVCAGKAPHSLKYLQKEYMIRGMKFLGKRYNGMVAYYPTQCLICGHKWKPIVRNIIYNGRGCPNCHNKTEASVRAMMEWATKHRFPKHSPNMLREIGIYLINMNKKRMYLDGYCPDLIISNRFYRGVAFEYHGYQHTNGDAHYYDREGGNEMFKQRQEDDKLRREQCEEQGILLIEIYEERDGGWQNLNELYNNLVKILDEKGIKTNKPNMSNIKWRQKAYPLENNTKQTTLQLNKEDI